MLMATHPAPEPGHAHGEYIPPAGTALVDDNAVDSKYGHGHGHAHAQGMEKGHHGAVGGGGGGANPYTGAGYQTRTTTTTTGTTMSPAVGGYKADF